VVSFRELMVLRSVQVSFVACNIHNAYGFSINPVREQALLANLPVIAKSVKKDIQDFFQQIDQIILQ